MSTRLISLTPRVDASPGEIVIGRLEIFNEGTSDATYTVDVVGLETSSLDEAAATTHFDVQVPATRSASCEVPIRVPRALGIGQHAAAFEVTSNRPNDRPVLTAFTLSIQSVARVELTPQPSTVRARRRATIHLDVANSEAQPVELTLDGEAPDVVVSFTPDRLSLMPGQRAVAKAKVKGPRRWAGESTQHNILITARGHASSTSVTAAYVQRPLFAHRLRMAVAALTVIALWLVAIYLWVERDTSTDAVAEITAVDTSGDGIPDTFLDADGNPITATDTDGDGIPDTFVDVDGNPIPVTDANRDGVPDNLVGENGGAITAVDTDGDGIPDTLSDGSVDLTAPPELPAAAPTSTSVTGTVTADGDPSNVTVTLITLELGAQPDPEATPVGFARGGNSNDGAKIWSARYARVDPLSNPVRQTQAIPPVEATPGADGVWLFPTVPLRQTYKLVFSKPGFNTQSFVVTPPNDGSPVQLDVELVPAIGSISGTVAGPDGPLGGVAIAVTDGTLSFETTTATDGATGTWSLEGVSTPSAYTITATLRGYGTQVLQLPLAAGDQRTGVNINMQRGVGTITGRVTDDAAQPLGGVTVTATNGDVTLTTSTLTEGDIGSYDLPQLPLGGTYTVKVELPDYITQTRSVPFGANVPGIDFIMSKTTGTLTSTVTSSKGGGIVGAGVILTTGELTFRVATGSAPAPGSFRVEDLPPGNYTVTVEHFEHQTATEFVTLIAGKPNEPLNIVLQATDGPPAVGTGSLVVTVLNSDPLADPPGIEGATVTLKRNRTADAPIVVTDTTSSNVRIPNLAIGTYTVTAVAPNFNSSPPTQVSVGLNEERRDIRLQQLGQASGTVVDPITGATLTDYVVTIYQDRTPAPDREVGRYREREGRWQTPANELTTGIYRVEITPTDAPDGYLVRNDQTLDTSAEVAGRPMLFVVPDVGKATPKQIVIAPIQADPYPTLSGRVYQPQLDGTATSFVPLDNKTLSVTATCNGDTAEPVQLFDNSGAIGADEDLYDEFLIDKSVVGFLMAATAPAPGSCELTITADGFAPAVATLSNVVASDGITLNDRRVNSAIAAPATPFSGSVFWLDGPRTTPLAPGQPADGKRALEGVAISASGVITGFVPVEGTPVSPDPLPAVTVGNLRATSDAAGAWSIPGQLFGASNYLLVKAGFGDALIPVSIGQGQVRTIGTPVAANVNPSTGSTFDIQLAPPNNGILQGTTKILSVNPTKRFAGAPISATSPTGGVGTVVRGAAGAFTIDPAAAGTWTVDFSAPFAHHVLQTGAASRVDQLINPGITVRGFDTTFVELGTVDVRLNGGVAVPGATVTLKQGGVAVGAPLTTVDGTGNYHFADVAVNTTATATTTVVPYTVDVTIPNYDTAGATVSTTQTGIPLETGTGTTDIPIKMVAGRVATVDITVQELGTIAGSVTGLTGFAPDEALTLVATPPTLPARVEPRRVNPDGSDLLPGDEGFGAAPAVVSPDGAGFSVKGPPGFYELTVTHPQYNPIAPANVPPDPLNPSATTKSVYEIRNVDPAIPGSGTNTLNAPFKLDIIAGNVSLEAIKAIVTPPTAPTYAAGQFVLFPVPGNNICINDPPPPSPAGTPPTSVSGDFNDPSVLPVVPATTAVVPGTYCVQARNVVAATQKAFPAFTRVVVTRAVNSVPSTIAVTVVLPDLVPEVTGRIIATNSNGTLVDLPDGLDFKIDSTYKTPDFATVGSGTMPNENDEHDRTSNATASIDAVSGKRIYSYTLGNMPAGEHDLALSVAPSPSPDPLAGYTLFKSPLTGISITAGTTSVSEDFVYTVASSDVTVQLTGKVGGAFPCPLPPTPPVDAQPTICTDSDRAQLIPPSNTNTRDPVTGIISGTAYQPMPSRPTDPPNTIRFGPVVPESGTWRLSITDALHEPVVDAPVTIPIGLVGDTRKIRHADDPVGTFVMAPKLVRFTGTVQRRFNASVSGIANLDSLGTVALTGGPSAPITLNGARSNYTFDLEPGTYTLTVSNGVPAGEPGYITETSSIDLTGLAGTIRTQDVTVNRNARVTVVVSSMGGTLPVPSGLAITLGGRTPDAGTTNVFTLPSDRYAIEITDPNIANPKPRYTGGSVSYPVGYNDTQSVVLDRLISINVKRASNASIAGATVTVTGTGYTSEVKTSTTGQFNFSSSDLALPLPTSGALTVTVSAPGFRTQQFSAGAVMSFEEGVVLQPNETLTGTIDLPTIPAGVALPTTPIVATSNDGQTRNGTITGSTYSIPDLDVGPNGESRTWTASFADTVGIGVGNSIVATVTSTSFTPPPDTTITVEPQDMVVNFKVTTGPADPPLTVADAKIVLGNPANGGGETITVAGGTGTITVKENTPSLSYTVSTPGYLPPDPDTSPTITRTRGTATPDPVPLSVATRPPITVNGSVFEAPNENKPLAGAEIVFCLLANPSGGLDSPCTETTLTTTSRPASATGVTPAVAEGSFTITSVFEPGTYQVWASKTTTTGNNSTTVQGDALLVVQADNTIPTTPLTITVKKP